MARGTNLQNTVKKIENGKQKIENGKRKTEIPNSQFQRVNLQTFQLATL